MTALYETAYPRLRSNLTDKELRELYTPTPEEMAFVQQVTSSPVTALGVVILLKTFQRLGYFPAFETLPPRLMAHLAGVMGTPNRDDLLRQYEANGYRWRHGPLIREYLHVNVFREGGRRVLVRAILEAAQSKDILADLINVGIEALVQARYELPAFSTLRRAAQKARAQVNVRYDQQVAAALFWGPEQALLSRLLEMAVSLLVLTLGFSLLFTYVPDVEIRWRDVWPGGVMTAVLFTVGKTAIGYYLGYASVGSAYGAAGSMVVLLVWVYYSALIVCFGAEFTHVWATRQGPVSPQPHAVPGAAPQTKSAVAAEQTSGA
jgi:hypothetical protein